MHSWISLPIRFGKDVIKFLSSTQPVCRNSNLFKLCNTRLEHANECCEQSPNLWPEARWLRAPHDLKNFRQFKRTVSDTIKQSIFQKLHLRNWLCIRTHCARSFARGVQPHNGRTRFSWGPPRTHVEEVLLWWCVRPQVLLLMEYGESWVLRDI